MATYIAGHHQEKLEPLPSYAAKFGDRLVERIEDPAHHESVLSLLERFIHHWEIQPGNYDLDRYRSCLNAQIKQ